MKWSEPLILAVVFAVTVGGGGISAFAVLKNRQQSVPPAQAISVSVQTVMHQTSAKYTLVEFMDYQCFPCRMADKTLPETLQAHKGKVDFVVRNFPLTMHTLAKPAAIAAEAAKEQGKFDAFRKCLFEEPNLSESRITQIAQQNHLDMKRFQKDCAAVALRRVEDDLRDAKTLKVNATPTFLLCTPDGKVFRLSTLAQLNGLVK